MGLRVVSKRRHVGKRLQLERYENRYSSCSIAGGSGPGPARNISRNPCINQYESWGSPLWEPGPVQPDPNQRELARPMDVGLVCLLLLTLPQHALLLLLHHVVPGSGGAHVVLVPVVWWVYSTVVWPVEVALAVAGHNTT
jgi:hypothetical protein